MAEIFFNEIPLGDTDLKQTPGRGAEQWHDRKDVNVPTEGIDLTPFDVYYRTTWNRFEGPTEGSFTDTWIRQRVTDAISKKQTFHFGIMSLYMGVDGNTGGVQVGGNWSAVPAYLITKMQSESPKSWVYGGNHIPNWNSPYYHARCLALCQWLNNWIQNTTINNVAVKNVVGIIDIRLYGNWGEWHSAFGEGFTTSQYPAGTFPTAASLIKIVDAHRIGFPNNPLVCMIAAFDANWLNNTNNPPEIANYILNARNNWGPIGWRRDQWGATDQYLKDYLENNNRSFNGGEPFKVKIMSRWQTAPITGEPPAWNPGDYYDLERQIRLYHATSFGNGNYGVVPNTTIKTRVRAASKACGYRFKVISAKTAVSATGSLDLTLNWQNIGLGNCWQDWNIVFELVGTNFRATSKHKLKFFQPSTTPLAVTESFPLTGVAAGTYALRFSVRDPNGFRVAMQLGISGADAGFNYSLGSVTVGAVTPPPNIGPRANAGGDIEITLPLNSAQLNGSGSDSDGPVSELTYLWTIVSGSGNLLNATSPIAQLQNLTAGTTVARLTVKDKPGATHSDDVNIKVNSAAPPPTGKKVVKVTPVVDYSIVTYDDQTTEVFDA